MTTIGQNIVVKTSNVIISPQNNEILSKFILIYSSVIKQNKTKRKEK